jgi:cytoskeletal protein CcmA (bactofilin family)
LFLHKKYYFTPPKSKAMLTKSKSSNLSVTSSQTSIVGVGMEIKGDIHTENDIRIDGKLTGNIFSKARVVIGIDGCIEGNIMALQADITGSVTGDIKTKELLSLRDKAIVKGNIETGRITIEPTANFNGSCKMLSSTALQIIEMPTETHDRKTAIQ